MTTVVESSPRSGRNDGALKGFETPRIWTAPARKLTPATSRGFECIKFARDLLGWQLFPWQKWLLIHALELNPDGTYRFDQVLVLVARQNGKTRVMTLLALWRMYLDGTKLVIGTAQKLDVAEEAWDVAVETVNETDENDEWVRPDLAGEVVHVDRTNGKKALRIKGGGRYKVSAANRRGGRGLSAGLVLLDELREHQSWEAWAAVTNTTLAIDQSLIFAFSNAGDASSVVLRALRLAALHQPGTNGGAEDRAQTEWELPPVDVGQFDGEADEGIDPDSSTAIFEWSAVPGRSKWDTDSMCQANPSLGHGTITVRKLRSFLRAPDSVCRPENLCEWASGAVDSVFGPDRWEACADLASKLDPAQLFACVDLSADRQYTSICFAGRNQENLPHGELVAHRAGIDWVLEWFGERFDPTSPHHLNFGGVTLQSNGAPVSVIHDELKALCERWGVPFVEWAGPDLGRATGGVFDLVAGRKIENTDGTETRQILVAHRNQAILTTAAAMARVRKNGDTWLWDRNGSPANIAPLIAWTGALWLLLHRAPAPKRISKYETRRLQHA